MNDPGDPRQELLDWREKLPDDLFDVAQPGFALLMEALCRQLGHRVVRDMCGIPGHDYCVFCGDTAEEIDRRGEGRANA